MYAHKPFAGQLGDSSNRDYYVKTATVLATVYVDQQSEADEDPLCLYNCSPAAERRPTESQQLQNSTVQYARTDRRFWLLTVVAGFFSTTEVPLIEEKLANLYRNAFMRQQALHLGISNQTKSMANNTISVFGHSRRRRSNAENIRPTKTLNRDTKEGLLSRTPKALPSKVQVVIHNMTHLTEAAIRQRTLDSQVDIMNADG